MRVRVRVRPSGAGTVAILIKARVTPNDFSTNLKDYEKTKSVTISVTLLAVDQN